QPPFVSLTRDHASVLLQRSTNRTQLIDLYLIYTTIRPVHHRGDGQAQQIGQDVGRSAHRRTLYERARACGWNRCSAPSSTLHDPWAISVLQAHSSTQAPFPPRWPGLGENLGERLPIRLRPGPRIPVEPVVESIRAADGRTAAVPDSGARSLPPPRLREPAPACACAARQADGR